jgi:hypothetical protein
MLYHMLGASARGYSAVLPCCWLQVWQDGHKRTRGDPNYLTLWKPIAPAGYVSMGVLASVGGREPPSANMVRRSSAAPVLQHMCILGAPSMLLPGVLPVPTGVHAESLMLHVTSVFVRSVL